MFPLFKEDIILEVTPVLPFSAAGNTFFFTLLFLGQACFSFAALTKM
jgi:hypothetical protein